MNATSDMQPEQIAEFLTRHPNFFNDFPTLLADLHIPHPHGTHAVSMGERQLIAMRDKVRMLENKLAELIQFGEENDGISEKLHALTLALVTASQPLDVATALTIHLRDGFAVPHHALRVWTLTGEPMSGLDQPVSQAAREDSVRTEKVESVQAALAAGTYSVPESAVARKVVDAMLGGRK